VYIAHLQWNAYALSSLATSHELK